MLCAPPKRERNRHGIDIESGPPGPFVAVPVKLAMMKATNRNRELIADLAPQRSRLREAKMVRIGGFAAAHEARLLGYEFEVVLVAQSNGLARRPHPDGASSLGDSL
jgi:hypothetical protein